MRGLGRSLLLTLLLGCVSAPALACPVCGTDTGRLVRQGIFDSDFGKNVLLTLLPFPILAGVVLAIYFGIPLTSRRPARPGGSRAVVGTEDV